jgi:hypothetical protein
MKEHMRVDTPNHVLDSNDYKVNVAPEVLLIGEDDAVRTGTECSPEEQRLISGVV